MSKRLLSVSLVLVILISSVGIAQVTHICKLALSGLEKVPCGDMSSDSHGCCSEQETSDESCCSNKIAFLKSEITSTTQPVLTAPMPAILALFESFQMIPENRISLTSYQTQEARSLWKASGPIFIEFRNLLI